MYLIFENCRGSGNRMLYYHRKTYDVLVYGGNMIISNVSEKRKKEEHRGKGHGADYKPWIYTNEFNSRGTVSNPVDYKTGRVMQLMSMGENKFYYLLRWDDNVVDIREQYPLKLRDTLKIAQAMKIRHPKNKSTRMTSDFLVDYADGSQKAFSVKYSRNDLDDRRTSEKLEIEERYWKMHGIPFEIVFSEDMDINIVTNIRLVTEYYDLNDVFDQNSYIKHLIATKQLNIPIDQGLLDFRNIGRITDGRPDLIWNR